MTLMSGRLPIRVRTRLIANAFRFAGRRSLSPDGLRSDEAQRRAVLAPISHETEAAEAQDHHGPC